MVRQVRFKTIISPTAAGSEGSSSVGVSVLYTSNTHETSDDVILDYKNIEITVPDGWGSNTLQIKNTVDSDNKGDSIFYAEPMADSFTMNIIIKAKGDTSKYYKLRDRFLRLWGTGEFSIGVTTYNGHGGSQWVNGYISNFVFNEFRSNNDVSGTATFTPTSPWYFNYGDITAEGISGYTFGKCPTIKGFPTVGDDGYASINCRFVEVRRVSNVGDMGFNFNCVDLSNPFGQYSTTIKPDDFESIPSSYSISHGYVYGLDDKGILIGRISLPQGILRFGMSKDAIVDDLHYYESYNALDVTYR